MNGILTTQDVAKILRVDTSTVRRWVKDGALEAITLPNKGSKIRYRFYREVIEKLINPPEERTPVNESDNLPG